MPNQPRTCPDCGNEVGALSKFCGDCSCQLPKLSDENKKERDEFFSQMPGGLCGNLQHTFSSLAGCNFCPFCGQAISGLGSRELN